MRVLYAILGYGEEHVGYDIITELALEFIARGHAYTIFAPAHLRQMTGRSADAVEDGVPVHRVVCGGRFFLDAVNALARLIFKFPWFLTCLWGLIRFLRAHPDFDLVIAEGAYPMGAMVYLATRLIRRPFIVYVSGGDFIANERANYGYARYRLARWFLRTVFKQAAVVRAESLYGAANVEKLGCPSEKLAVVQRNIGQMTFLPPDAEPENYRRAAREKIARRFGLTAPRLIVTVGRLLPIKGFDGLIRVLPRVIERAGDTQILHVGANRLDSRFGDYQKYLQNLAAELGVAERVTFVGEVPHEQVRDFLAAADVVAVPSVEEGGNKMVMEAAAVGTPFVASRTAGTPEWATEWNCGVIVAPLAPDELTDGLVRILRDPELARRMGQNGLKFAEHFRAARVAERTWRLCEVALSGIPLPRDLKQPEEILSPSDRYHDRVDVGDADQRG